MTRILSIVLVILGLSCASFFEAAAAEKSRELAGALSRLQDNPRYRGRILGTHIKRDNGGYLYEVRILRGDDRVILVYIDPETGRIVDNSKRRGKPRKKSNRKKK